MDLVALAKNPAPSGATTGILKCPNGMRLRFARWEPTRGPRRGTVCLFHGRGEFIEKYFEVVADLRRRGFAVATMDWRGQGGSARLLRNTHKGHVRSFADYDQDLAHFMREIVLPDCQPPYVALAHSMGGNILLRNASLSGSWFSRMVLSAPMIDIAPDKLGAPHAVSRAYAETLGAIGLRLHVHARGPRSAARVRALRGQPAHLRPRALPAQPAGAGGGAGARPGLADDRLAARGAALDRQADVARLSAAGWRCRCCCSPPAWTRSSRRARSRSSRCA